jgi:serine/threonine-protein kinase
LTNLGRYQLVGQLATGGMAEIHLARLAGEAGFEKTVVVKRLLPELVASKAFVAMFLDEGKLVARIDHPNVCEVYELGRDGNEYFLVMPYLDGVPATDFIARPRESDRLAQLRVAAGIVTQACAGLHHAHELRDSNGESFGLVHRDVSPSNLFVTTAGVVKVLDFGIAKVRGGEATEVGTIKGKTQYMAPEQLAGDAVDRRCDVFALGIVLFELATHQRLFKRSSEFLTAKAIIEEAIPRADAVDPAVPAALADVIAKALARNREDRFATARDLATAIKGAIEVAAPNEIADALATWHGEELSALRTRQLKVIEEASQVTTAPGGRLVDGASQVVTRPARPQSVRDDIDGRVRDDIDGRASNDIDGRASNDIDGRAGDIDDHLVIPRRSTLSKLLPAILAGAGGIGVIAFFATRPSPFTTSHTVRDAHVGTNEKMGSDPISNDEPVRAARISNTGSNAPNADAAIELALTTPVDAGGAQRPDTATVEQPSVEHHEPTRPATRPKPGTFSIDSTPFATIYVDGKRFGLTPLVKKQLPAGPHKIRATLKDGRSKDITIDVPSGKSAPPVRLTW